MITLIGDACSNHGGNINNAFKMVEFAKLSGLDVLKWQYLVADDLYRKDHRNHAIIQSLELPKEWLSELKSLSDTVGIEFACTPFSPRAVEDLEKVGVRFHKIASGDISYVPLLQAVGQTRKPVLLSTAHAVNWEILKAINILIDSGSDWKTITLLHCQGHYPCMPEQANLSRLRDMSEFWPDHIGLSSHIQEWHCDLPALAYGITCIEKHYGLTVSDPEASHSLMPDEMAQFVRAVRDCEAALLDVRDENPEFLGLCRRNESDWLRPALREGDTIAG